MSYQEIQLECGKYGVATLWLNRAKKNNAFNATMISELINALDAIKNDQSINIVVLRGRGKHFSAGADLSWMKASAQLDYAANLADSHELGELMHKLYHLPQPTLAIVQGAAFGGAVGLIACCDMAIGADDAVICLSEVRIGLAPAVISPFVVKALGQRAARRYALTAERFSGQCAAKLGLLSESYPASSLNEAAQLWLDNLRLNSPQAMTASKALLIEVAEGKIDTQTRAKTEQTIAALRVSPEGQEGLNSFFEKRSPSWQETL